MNRLLSSVAVLLASLGLASLARGSEETSPPGSASPVDFVERGRALSNAPPGQELGLVLLLRADDRGLARAAYAVSTPGSGKFRSYLDSEEIADRFGASQEVRREVVATLAARGISSEAGADGLWIEATATVEQAESLFSTDLKSYSAGSGLGRFIAPAEEPRIPPELFGAIEGVVGLDTEPAIERPDPPTFRSRTALRVDETPPVRMNRQQGLEFNKIARELKTSVRANLGSQKGCSPGRNAATPLAGTTGLPDGLGGTYIPAYTPNQIHSAYGIDSLRKKGLNGEGERIAVIEIDGFKRSDLEEAAKCFGFRAPPTPVKLIDLKKRLAPGGETTLDLQVIAAAVPGVEEIRIVQGKNDNSALLRQHIYLLNLPKKKRPSVVSASLGACEAGLTKNGKYRKGMERVLKTAALKGVTMIASAGDTGSSGCALAGNEGALGQLSVEYVASSPWITGVGGTNMTLNQGNGITEEVVWNNSPLAFGGGSGGVSQFFNQPKWQRGPGVGSLGKRSVPDISMLADNLPGWSIFCTVEDECTDGWLPIGGTSAAAPLTASIALMANQQARKSNGSRLGFLNPSIYEIARREQTRKATFRDVLKIGNDLGSMIGPTDGGNNQPLGCCKATRNYDRASGWGSIEGPSFIGRMLRLARG
ncbi:MAG: hypothetical protein FGM38_05910 [Solirubrobacterales bacterium]|nr:hypothetical protein [Solirubrobacterales bacterium]